MTYPWLDLKENIQTVVELEKLNSGIPMKGSTALNVEIRRVVVRAQPYTQCAQRFMREIDVSRNDSKSNVGGGEGGEGFSVQGGRALRGSKGVKGEPRVSDRQGPSQVSRQQVQSRNHRAWFCPAPMRNRKIRATRRRAVEIFWSSS